MAQEKKRTSADEQRGVRWEREGEGEREGTGDRRSEQRGLLTFTHWTFCTFTEESYVADDRLLLENRPENGS